MNLFDLWMGVFLCLVECLTSLVFKFVDGVYDFSIGVVSDPFVCKEHASISNRQSSAITIVDGKNG